MMPILFTKEGCHLCDSIKTEFDTISANISIADVDTPVGLARLTFHGLVERARQSMPLLLWSDESVYAYSEMKSVLEPWARTKKTCQCIKNECKNGCKIKDN